MENPPLTSPPIAPVQSTSGFKTVIIVAGSLLILSLTGLSGYQLGRMSVQEKSPGGVFPMEVIPLEPTLPITDEGEGVACTMDAKICPDGTAVGRSGPNCEFSPCPTTDSTETPATEELPVENPV